MNRIEILPNILTGYRFAVVPFLLFCLRPDVSKWVGMLGFFLFLSGALSDLADGYLARKFHVESVLGKLMDPLADKVLVTAGLVLLIPMGRVAAWVAFLILAREMIITGLRGLAASSGIVMAASRLGKWKSVAQLTALCILVFPLGVLPIPFLHELGTVILYIALALTLWSGCDYFIRFQKLYLGAGGAE
ncbi:MAG: CDP-diacylglycerol--glycerol-3-phosphate 3-phosphatidyltransferase [Pseudomonadota bacterium]|nr:CDP-diacylglycerol--glycerol-3-phosphate 3-phosphatidyltransferase [Pseudomonadota bacterium]